MLWFFGLLSLSAFVCTVLLWLRDHTRAAAPLPATVGGGRACGPPARRNCAPR